MHRAGTSALAGALDAVGVPLGRRLVPAEADNPGGYFENADGVELHERLLLALGRGWDDLRPLPEGWLDSDAGEAAEQALDAWLDADFAGVPLWAFKDPRSCRLLPLWQRVLARRGITPAYVFSLRAPEEVARSLQARDGQSAWQARLLWAQHLLQAERDTRGALRTAVAYDDLLADPVATLERLAADLGLAWPRAARDNPDLVARIDPTRRHHRHAGEPVGDSATWVAQLHAASRGLQAGGDDGRALAALGAGLDERLKPLLAIGAGPFEAVNRSRRAAAGLRGRLGDTERGLEEARTLSLERLQALAERDARLEQVQSALEEASALSLSRMHEVIERDRRLEEVHAGLEATKQLANQRLAELGERDAALAERDAALAERDEKLRERDDQIASLQAEIAEVYASRSWRLTRPLRALRRLVRRGE